MSITYTVLIALKIFFLLMETLTFYYFTMCASIALHNKVFSKVIKAKLSFFDSHMTGNILNRFAKDMGIIDEFIPIFLRYGIKVGEIQSSLMN